MINIRTLNHPLISRAGLFLYTDLSLWNGIKEFCLYVHAWVQTYTLPWLVCEVRGQPECIFPSATLLETGSVLFATAYARLADLRTCRDSPISTSHCRWESGHYRYVHYHVWLYVGPGGSSSNPHISTTSPWPTEPSLQPWTCLFSDRNLPASCTHILSNALATQHKF